jgi:hypothetical protein
VDRRRGSGTAVSPRGVHTSTRAYIPPVPELPPSQIFIPPPFPSLFSCSQPFLFSSSALARYPHLPSPITELPSLIQTQTTAHTYNATNRPLQIHIPDSNPERLKQKLELTDFPHHEMDDADWKTKLLCTLPHPLSPPPPFTSLPLSFYQLANKLDNRANINASPHIGKQHTTGGRSRVNKHPHYTAQIDVEGYR